MAKTKKNQIEKVSDEEKQEFASNGVTLDFASTNQLLLQDIRRMLIDQNARPRKYSREQIRTFMESPQVYEKQLREVSQYYLVTSPHYRRVIAYFATMLTLDHFPMPIATSIDKVGKNETFRRNYERTLKYLEGFNVKHELTKVVKVLLTEGVFYGYESTSGSSTIVRRLDTNYCKLAGQDDGTWTFYFNFAYFNGSDKVKNLDNYPDEFATLYAKAKREGQFWQELDHDKAICFKFDEDVLYSVPPFIATLEDIMDLEDFKALSKGKSELDNYKLLVQEIPMKKEPKNEKDFVLTRESVAVFHDNLKSAVPTQVGVVTTPMKITDYDFEKARQKEDTIGNAENAYFTSIGVSKPLFNASGDTSVGLNKSIEVDAAFMYPLLLQFERFFKKRLAQINNSTYPFKVIFPPLTVYNRNEMLTTYTTAASFGFPKAYVAAALGIGLGDLVSLTSFENDFLGLSDILIPLQSANTTAGGDQGGRPQKPDSKISDSGVKTRDGNKNQTTKGK